MQRTINAVLATVPDPATRKAMASVYRILRTQMLAHTHLCGGDGVVSSTAIADAAGKTGGTAIVLPE